MYRRAQMRSLSMIPSAYRANSIAFSHFHA
jgi:hypothetical protein